MADARTSILKGTKAAHDLHRQLGIQETMERKGLARVDVFNAIAKLKAALMFQPLDKLLGAYLPEKDAPGVLITTNRPLSVQRLTGSHELGHLFMRHEPSLDDENILRRSPFSTSGKLDPQEREADAFAITFLAPLWLVALNMQRQKWAHKDFSWPQTIYQASLRLGISYSAACYILERHKVISRESRARLIDVEPKTVKQDLLRGYEPPDWRSDVWLLSERDEGTLIEGGRNDLFVVRLRENSSAGYVWNFDELANAGFAIVKDDREAGGTPAVGGSVTRRVTARSEARTEGQVVLKEGRPWLAGKSLHETSLRYDLRGPEAPGMWEPQRDQGLPPG